MKTSNTMIGLKVLGFAFKISERKDIVFRKSIDSRRTAKNRAKYNERRKAIFGAMQTIFINCENV